jgi:RNA polymerase sigma-70 factor, ECF subfamily
LKRLKARSDSELAISWQQGNAAAYEELVRRHLDAVRGYVRVRCGDDHDAADICQEVFIEVCRKIGNFDPAYAFSAWLYTIARRKLVDRFRRWRPVERFDPEVHSGEIAEHPSSILEARESAQEAWERVFRTISEAQATALWLRVQEQRSVSEIAEVMNQSESNVKVLLFRARQKLAREWHAETTSEQ